MQNIKITQIEPVVRKRGNDLTFIIFDFLTKFKLKNICDRFHIQKEQGHSAIEILFIVLSMPFMLVTSINAIFRSEFKWVNKRVDKCSIYRFLSDSRYDWRRLIYRICVIFTRLFPASGETAFIIDDTVIKKEGYKGEKITKVYDHCSKRFHYGFKQVVLTYCDGKSVIPVDSSLHGEKSLKGKTDKQYMKPRKSGSAGAKRAKEHTLDKLTSALKMVCRAIKEGLKAKYVIFDSWYAASFAFIKGMIANGLIVVCAMPVNRKCVHRQQNINISKVLAFLKNSKKPKRCAARSLRYYETTIEMPELGKVKLCLCRKISHKEWKAIISTDVSMSALAIMKVYALRWSIEVFFKEAKNLLRMGKCQSVDFDAQIANISISLLLYIVMAYYRRIMEVDTTGTLFETVKKDIYEKTIAENLWQYFVETIEKIFKDLYDEGKTIVKKIKNTSVFKTMKKSQIDFGKLLESLN